MITSHYRFTKNLTLWVNTINKIIRIIGGFNHEHLKEAEFIAKQYDGYIIETSK